MGPVLAQLVSYHFVILALILLRGRLTGDIIYILLAGFLPVKLLVELLNFSLLNDVAGKVTSTLAMELDKRLKKSLLGDENYKLGDATKRTIANAVQNYTGKDQYEFGDGELINMSSNSCFAMLMLPYLTHARITHSHEEGSIKFCR